MLMSKMSDDDKNNDKCKGCFNGTIQKFILLAFKVNNGCKLLVICFFIVLVFFSILLIIDSRNPKLVIPRYNHSAIVLQDGRILITGGETIINRKSIKLDTAEIYDPKTKKCTLIKNKMNYERSNHSSVLLPNGNVLIIGGGSQIQEIFDAKNTNFLKHSASSDIKDIAIAVKINDKSIIIVSPSNNIIEKFDIKNNKFKKIGILYGLNTSSKRFLNYNGILFFPIEKFNTADLSIQPKEKIFVSYYDYKKNIIGNITKPQSLFDFCVGNMISEVNNELVHFCYKDKLYTEIYDFKSHKFIKKGEPSIFTPKIDYITLKYNDVIILLGGYKFCGPLKPSNTIDVYDSQTNRIYEKFFNKINAAKGYSSIQTEKEIIIIGGLIAPYEVTNEIQTIEIERILKWLR